MMDVKFFCFGHGTVVADRDAKEGGEYRHIAYIRPSGVLELRVPESQIPKESLALIKQQAEKEEEKFMAWWQKQPTAYQYKQILDVMTLSELTSFDRSLSMEQTIDLFFERYRERA